MIQANELRIGNYIADIWTPNGLFKVTELRKDKIFYGNCFKAKYDDIRPIPLTEEILLKAGGKRFDEDKIILMLNDPSTHLVLMKVGTHWFPQIEQTGEFASEGVNVVFLNFIDYLHQLQNLFFALTGEEIKIELE
ncbi:MAG: hypothetical protein DI622_16700 [Chryseobacterium sp.]|nr:MAG: hypothetical protein DI622_16700 [Chryseobacterium sp.]